MVKYKDTTTKNDNQTVLKFHNMARKVNAYLKDKNVTLTFEGYQETLSDYFNLQDNDIAGAYQMMILCNLWNNYFAEVEGIVQLHLYQAQLQVDYLKAHKVPREQNEDLETEIKSATQEYYLMRLFYKQVKGQRKFFIKAYYHCSKLYYQSADKLLYKALD